MGLLPDQWWAMTPREFEWYAEGHQERLEHEMERLAWHAANIINHRTPAMGEKRRKAVTIDDLLGRRKSVPTTKEEFLAQLEKKYQEREAGW